MKATVFVVIHICSGVNCSATGSNDHVTFRIPGPLGTEQFVDLASISCMSVRGIARRVASGMAQDAADLESLTREQLIARLQALKTLDTPSPSSSTPRQKERKVKELRNKHDGAINDVLPIRTKVATPFADHPVRKVALLMSYEGWHYSGLAIQAAGVEPPTVEGVLLAALEKTHLIEQGAGWEGCGFSRCGRTDRGVSSSGQVVSLWLRSKRRKDDGGANLGADWQPHVKAAKQQDLESQQTYDLRAARSPIINHNEVLNVNALEFPYPYLLNRVLPPNIRILGWSPLPDNPSFDARFSCMSRHYKYFFPLVPVAGRPPLDLQLMQEAADNLIGEHDFRNFCKIDGSKQIQNHARAVVSAKLLAVGDDGVFELVGSAFLWHQVRHIMAVLLLVGSGLEDPSVVTSLLNTSSSSNVAAQDLPSVDTVNGKPVYSMAAALPLQLYRCNYAEGHVDWRYGGYDGPYQTMGEDGRLEADASSQSNVMGLLQTLKSQAIEANMRARHIQEFYDEAAAIHSAPLANPQELGDVTSRARVMATLFSVGAGEVQSTKNYVPLLRRPRAETPDDINRKWMEGSGQRRALRKAAESVVADNVDVD